MMCESKSDASVRFFTPKINSTSYGFTEPGLLLEAMWNLDG